MNNQALKKFIELTVLGLDKKNLTTRKRLINVDSICTLERYYPPDNKKLDAVEHSARSIVRTVDRVYWILESYNEIKEKISLSLA